MSPRVRVVVCETTGEVVDTVPSSKPWSWQTVPKKDRGWLREVTEQIRAAAQESNEQLIRVGRYLQDVKGRLPHGQFLAWVDAEFPWSRRMAQLLMSAAAVFGDVRGAQLAHFDQTAIYALSGSHAPPEAATKALAAAARGERVSHERAVELVMEARWEPEKRPSPPVGEEQLSDRFDELLRTLLLPTGHHADPVPAVAEIPWGVLKLVRHALFPHVYPEDAPPPAPPIWAPPGSAKKIGLMALRAAAGLPLTQKDDQLPDATHVPRVKKRAGGAGADCPYCGKRMEAPPEVDDEWEEDHPSP